MRGDPVVPRRASGRAAEAALKAPIARRMPTLLTIPFSHFCEKARWALDHTRVAYREEGHCPGLHRRAVKLASGKGGSVPVL
ncbi:MAG TPA: glutathione S-transferase N-terminal domain-containing protein, partial [Polyangiaceae bacterium]|nr:glutathione S-transferase N-terminal domain-containing protein [Polyangiaceae bacterium]